MLKALNIRNIAYVSVKEDTETYVDINSFKFSIFIKEQFTISGIAFIDLNIMNLLVSMHCFYLCMCVCLCVHSQHCMRKQKQIGIERLCYVTPLRPRFCMSARLSSGAQTLTLDSLEKWEMFFLVDTLSSVILKQC